MGHHMSLGGTMTPIERALQPTASEWGSSRFGEWRRCQVAHDLKYRLSIVPAPRPIDDMGDWEGDDTGYFDTGTACHLVLRYVQESRLFGDCDPARWADVLGAWVDSGATPEEKINRGAARLDALILMGAYWSHYEITNAGWPEGTRILAVEKPLGVAAGVLGPLPYTATADVILEMPSGDIVVVDHKTRGRPLPKDTARYGQAMSVRAQFVGLSWLVARDLGLATPPQVWVNAIIKPTKTIGPRFGRVWVPMTGTRLATWEWMQRQTATAMSGAVGAPRPDWSTCAPEVGSRCAYFLHCHGSSEDKEQYYVKKE